MQPREVRVYLLDALSAAESILEIRSEVGQERLRRDRIVRAAIERFLITIGESLNKAAAIDAGVELRISHLRAMHRAPQSTCSRLLLHRVEPDRGLGRTGRRTPCGRTARPSHVN